jgi:DNA-binding transcriptional ArsR family regulator
MVRDRPRGPNVDADGPSPAAVLDALGDEGARELLGAVEEPKTASELSEECGIPLSTTYRKLDRLTEAGLLEETTEIRRDGQHTTRYRRAVAAVTVSADGTELDVELDRPDRSTDERLAELWSQVREETRNAR